MITFICDHCGRGDKIMLKQGGLHLCSVHAPKPDHVLAISIDKYGLVFDLLCRSVDKACWHGCPECGEWWGMRQDGEGWVHDIGHDGLLRVPHRLIDRGYCELSKHFVEMDKDYFELESVADHVTEIPCQLPVEVKYLEDGFLEIEVEE